MQAMPSAEELHERALRRYKTVSGTSDIHRCRFVQAEQFELGLRSVGTTAVPRKWIRKLHGFEEFYRREGHVPRKRTPHCDERTLAEWAYRERPKRPGHCGYQAVRLQVSPAFMFDPGESVWLERARQVEDVIKRTGYTPAWDLGDPTGYALAKWWARQHLAFGRG